MRRTAFALMIAAVVAGLVLLPSNKREESRSLGHILLTAGPANPGDGNGNGKGNGNGQPGISDSKAGQPILQVSTAGMEVGKPISGSVTIAVSGGAAETVSVWQQNLTTGPPASPNLSTWAQLTVKDTALSGASQSIYSGSVAGFFSQARVLCGMQQTKQSSCPKWMAGEAHTFEFTVVIPDAVTINSYQGTWLKTDYQWSATV